RRIAEADVNRGSALNARERPIQRFDAVLLRALREALHPRLVELDHVRTRGKELLYLLVDGSSKLHRKRLAIGVVGGFRLLRHRKRARQCNLDLPISVCAQESDISNLHRCKPAHRTGKQWDWYGYSSARVA